MEKIKLTVTEWYQLRAELSGLSITSTGQVLLKGFINESGNQKLGIKGITEGTKRIANRALKFINSELTEIDKQRIAIKNWVQPEDEEEKMNDEALKKYRDEKEKELMEDLLEIELEKLDSSKLDDLCFEGNYPLIQEKLYS